MQIEGIILCLHALNFVILLEIFCGYKDLKLRIEALRDQGKSIGFVPTMGALHQGHIMLVERALAKNEVVVVSIFVNPTQFDNANDLGTYPRTLEEDKALLAGLGAKQILVYTPTVNDVYDKYVGATTFDFHGLEHQMEGAFRKGHFNGVATVVKRLLEIVTPDIAYFGEKDFQQLQIIKKLVQIHNIPVKIEGCSIARAKDGLALSSRNVRLSAEQRAAAPFIYKTLKLAKMKFASESAKQVMDWVTTQFASQPLLELEYISIADEATLVPVKRKSNKKTYRAFIAVYAGNVRLIDNIALN